MSAAKNPNDARGPAQVSPIPPRHSSTTTTAAGPNSASGGTSSPNVQPASTQIATQSVAAPNNNNGTASTTTNNAAAAADTSRNNANSGAIDVSGTEEGEDVFAPLKEKQEREFSICKIWKHTKGRSDVYNHMHRIAIDEKKVAADPTLADFIESSEGLKMVRAGKHFICKFCQAQGLPLEKCLKAMTAGDTSNGNTHLKEQHGKEREAAKKKREATNNNTLKFPVIKAKKKKITKKSTASIEAEKKLQHLIFTFVNNGGLPTSVINDSNFHEMIDFVREKAGDLRDYKHMGNRKFISIQCNSFAELLSVVQKKVENIREWYKKHTGSRQAFIVVGHDVWDGRRKKINGLTIFFTDPETLETFRIPIALTPPIGETALELCETAMLGLERVGIEMEDIFRAVSDNCSTAVKAGRLIVAGGDEALAAAQKAEGGPKPACDMHLGSLAFGLALSLVERRQGGRVINRWDPFQDLFKDLKKMVNYVSDKKNKRFHKYKEALEGIQQTAFLISMPNSTRVAGAHIMMQDALRSKGALTYYQSCKCQELPIISKEQWKLLAQFEAVLRPAMKLCFDIQGDRVEIAGESVLALVRLKIEYEEEEVYEVVDTDADAWDAGTSFSALPTIKMTPNTARSLLDDGISKLDDHAIELIERYKNSLEEYFGDITDDRLLAFAVNPILATEGCDDVQVLLGEEEGGDLKNRAEKLLAKSILKIADKLLTDKSSSGNGNDNESPNDEDGNDTASDANMSRRELLKARKSKSKQRSVSSSSPIELATQATKAFFNMNQQNFDIEKELKNQRDRKGEGCDDIDWKLVQEDTLYASSKFDLCEWWLNVGREKHPLVFLVVPSIVSLPAANAFQERVFSACTHFDDPLRQRLKEARFEMAVLLSINESLLSDTVPTEDEAKKIVEDIVAKFDADSELEDCLDLFRE